MNDRFTDEQCLLLKKRERRKLPVKVSEHLLLPRGERTDHCDLTTPCLVDGSVSSSTRQRRGRKVLLDKLGLEDDIENWAKAGINLCHVCDQHSSNGWCTNPDHLYVGTALENCWDKTEEARKAPGRRVVELKAGVHNPKNKEVVREGSRKGGQKGAKLGVGLHAPGKQAKGGRKSTELKVGLHDPKNKEAVLEGSRKGGRTTAETLNKRKRLCLVTGHVSTPGPLACVQKAQGVPTHLYAELDGSDLVSQTVLLGLAQC